MNSVRLMSSLRLSAILVALFALLALPAMAQEAPDRQGQRQMRGERKASAPGEFDFYVLALSWSPGFCAARDEGMREKAQCASGAGMGFVVHGLWPQNETGFPTECGPSGRTPSRMARDAAKGVYPEEDLAAVQWRRHGTCSGKSPTEYFADVKFARERITIPSVFAIGTKTEAAPTTAPKSAMPIQSLAAPTAAPAVAAPDAAQKVFTPLEVERAFVEANPGLRTDMMSVSCRKELMQEVRICMTKDLREFRPCAELDRRGCRAPTMKIASPR